MTNHQSLFSPLVERAMRVAARSHRQQTRKASDLPYLTHPASVALLLVKAGIADEEILAAALLHDVVEDTDCSLADLAAQFPPKVIELVAALSERKRDDSGQKRSWQDRKIEHLEHIKAASWEARAITLADKLHNLGTMVFDLETDPDLWSHFNAPRDRLCWYYREMIAAAFQEDARLAVLARECSMLVEQLFGVQNENGGTFALRGDN
ncbi:MAG: HD domain-containing protein [Planctomycetaceae bacterium]